MHKKKLSNVFAFGVGFAAIATHADIFADSINQEVVFGIQPQEISLSVCDEDNISIGNIHQMICDRNERDKMLVRSSVDKIAHL